MTSSPEPVEHPVSSTLAPEDYTVIQARVPFSDYDAFIDICPQHGAITWFVRTALEEFIKQYKDVPSARENIRRSILEFNANK